MTILRPHIVKSPSDLMIENISASDLVKKHGSPLYVYSKARIRENYLNLINAFKKYTPRFEACYAIKANSNLSIMKILQSEGAGADCSSASEIHYAIKAGFDPRKSLFTAVNPTHEDLSVALEKSFRINLDDHPLLDEVLEIRTPEIISFRINPGMGAGKFDQIIVGGEGAKFGMNEDQVLRAYEKALRAGIRRFGIHMMTGSCILDAEYFSQVSQKLLQIAGHVARELKIQFEYIDIGGGLGIPYESHEKPLDLDAVARNVLRVFDQAVAEYKLGQPTLMMEPGRYFVGDAGVLLCQVTHLKEQGKKIFLGVDAGMTTLIRPALYGAHHDIIPIGNSKEQEVFEMDVVGPICESTDFFAKNRLLPKMKRGELLAILDAGAYAYAMSSPYNGRLRPAEVLVDQNKATLIRRAENVEDVFALQNL